MPILTALELKRALQSAGFEVYRTRGQDVQLAERPRENQIMDAGVTVRAGDTVRVVFVTRAQKSDFPNESDEALADRARALAASALSRGFIEREVVARTLHDPGDASRVLDIWHEVFFEKSVSGVEEALVEIRFGLALDKTAHLAQANGPAAYPADDVVSGAPSVLCRRARHARVGAGRLAGGRRPRAQSRTAPC